MVFRDTGSRKSQIAGLKSFRELRKSQREADMEALDSETKKNKKKAKKQTERYPKKMPEEAVLFLRMMARFCMRSILLASTCIYESQ